MRPMLLSLAFLVTALTPHALLALEDPVLVTNDEVAAEIDRLIEEFDAASTSWIQKYREATDDESRTALMKERPNALELAPKILGLAEKNPDGDAAFHGYTWTIHSTRRGPEFEKALELVAKHFLQDERVESLVNAVRGGSEANNRFLTAIYEKSPSRQARGIACYNLAAGVKQRLDYTGSTLSSEQRNELLETAEKYYDLAFRDYSDVEMGRRGTIGSWVEVDLFELHNLSPGKTAPDIEGEDLDGVPFKLSDYRGKVVMLDFWGDW